MPKEFKFKHQRRDTLAEDWLIDSPNDSTANAQLLSSWEFNADGFLIVHDEVIGDVYLVPPSLEQTPAGLYRDSISEGPSSEVFGGFQVTDASYGHAPMPVVVKRIKFRPEHERQLASSIEMLMELRATPHPNIVRIITACRDFDLEEAGCNLVFPAVVGNLTQLINGTLANVVDESELANLWTQFEGLASGLAHLHHEMDIAHAHLSTSKILVERVETSFGSQLVLKISGFKHSVHPGHGPSNKPVANEISESQAADLWNLASVFTETATYLVGGPSLVQALHRLHATSFRMASSADPWKINGLIAGFDTTGVIDALEGKVRNCCSARFYNIFCHTRSAPSEFYDPASHFYDGSASRARMAADMAEWMNLLIDLDQTGNVRQIPLSFMLEAGSTGYGAQQAARDLGCIGL